MKDEGLSIALGGLEKGLTPLQMAAAYRTFMMKVLYRSSRSPEH
ncbi:hypothetical protein [Piscibacillus salipiscarius]|nr:hypothetical protein [Piscibacillus salipiscarius]